jgi:hypothetical protein
MAVSGLILAQMAEKLGISDRTMDTWVKVHPELKDAIRPGKEFIDNLVEGSLLKRALGYDIVEVTRENIQVGTNLDGTVKFRMKVTKRVTKHIPGEVAANIFWLKNRKGWRDRVDYIHGGGITIKPDYSKLSEEELVIMRALAAKAEAHAGSN